MISERDLERSVDGFGAGIAEKYVIQIGRREFDQPISQLECRGMSHREGRYEIELPGLPADRVRNRPLTVTGVDAPQSGQGIEHLPSVGSAVVHPVGSNEESRILSETAIRSERHPESVAERRHARGPLIAFLRRKMSVTLFQRECKRAINSHKLREMTRK